MLTRKGKCVATLRQAQEEAGGEWPAEMPSALTVGEAVRGDGGVWELAPPAFVFHPSKGEANPHDELCTAFSARAARVAPANNRWILKPSEGAKGEGIFIVSQLDEIQAHLATQVERAEAGDAVSSWVVQRYIHNPLLLAAGQRKFDIRCWVLVDSKCCSHLAVTLITRCYTHHPPIQTATPPATHT